MLIDSHAHLDDERFEDDLPAVLRRAEEGGLSHILTVGTGLESCESAIALAASNRSLVSAAVAIHPHDAKDADEAAVARLRELARRREVVAVGETGLDYYYDNSPREAQRSVFEWHLKLALDMDLPVIVHCREAFRDGLAILRKFKGAGLRGVAHCFSGSEAVAQEFLELGFYVSFAGPLTFRNAAKVRAVAAAVPLGRTLIETDCPYLAPHPKRGKRNEPSFVRYVAEKLAEVHGTSMQKVAETTSANARRLFRLDRALL